MSDGARPLSLLDAADAIARIVSELDDGEVTPEAAAQLDALGLTIEQKAEAYHVVCQRLTAEAEACADEAARLMDRARARKAAADRLSDRLREAMGTLDVERIKTPLITCYLQPTKSVEITGDVPREWCLPPKNPEPSKSLIKEALELDPRGECSRFARIVTKQSVRFR